MRQAEGMSSTQRMSMVATVLLGGLVLVLSGLWWWPVQRPTIPGAEVKTHGDWDDCHFAVCGLACSPDAKFLACSAWDFPANTQCYFIRVWDAAAGKELRTLEQPSEVTALAFSADGGRLATMCLDDDGRIHLWNTRSWQEAAFLDAHNRPICAGLAFSRDGKTLASGSDDARDPMLRLWDLGSDTARVIRVTAKKGMRGVAFSPDGAVIASAGSDGPVEFWDAVSGAPRGSIMPHPNPESEIAGSNWVGYALGGKTVVTLETDLAIHLWDAATLKERAALPRPKYFIDAVALSPDGRTLATASALDADYDMDAEWWGEVALWDIATAKQIWRVRGVSGSVKALAFLDDRRLVVGTTQVKLGDGGIQIWDVARPPRSAKE